MRHVEYIKNNILRIKGKHLLVLDWVSEMKMSQQNILVHIIGRHLSSFQSYLEYLYVSTCVSLCFQGNLPWGKKIMRKDQAILAKILWLPTKLFWNPKSHKAAFGFEVPTEGEVLSDTAFTGSCQEAGRAVTGWLRNSWESVSTTGAAAVVLVLPRATTWQKCHILRKQQRKREKIGIIWCYSKRNKSP